MSDEIRAFLLGSVVTLGVSLITILFQHLLSLRRDKIIRYLEEQARLKHQKQERQELEKKAIRARILGPEDIDTKQKVIRAFLDFQKGKNEVRTFREDEGCREMLKWSCGLVVISIIGGLSCVLLSLVFNIF
jgi:hypothetical protein